MNIVSKVVFGSHLYGLNTPESDTDYKAIYLPEYRDIILGKDKRNITTSTGANNSKNTKDDEDFEIFSLKEFVKLACQGQTVAIDYLHSDNPIINGDVHQFLVQNRTKFYTKNMNSFMGYLKKQAAKYGIKGSKLATLEEIIRVCDNHELSDYYENSESSLKEIAEWLPITEYTIWKENVLPDGRIENFYVVNGTMMHDVIPLSEFKNRIQKQYDNYGARAIQAKNNNGIDWKAISHALRAGYQLQDIFELGDFEYPLRQTKFLLDVKLGKLDYITEVAPVLEELVDKLDRMAIASNLPDKVDTEFWDDFVFEIYSNLK